MQYRFGEREKFFEARLWWFLPAGFALALVSGLIGGAGPGEREIIARAWNSAAQTQPERLDDTWNVKGYVNNAWHRVAVKVIS